MKYQFSIRFTNTTVNSAATKAVLDCNTILSDRGYADYTITVADNRNKIKYYLKLIKELTSFFRILENGSIVGVQYPLLSINGVFKFFIKLAKLKGVDFFCIIHDLESLRTGGDDKASIDREIANLNEFDCIIAHNPVMIKWLTEKGLQVRAVSLEVFDYLAKNEVSGKRIEIKKTIVFAGNLNKSAFIYSLNQFPDWNFNVYGPNFSERRHKKGSNLKWQGEYSATDIVQKLKGTFGLIWDGANIDSGNDNWTNYLAYNNPHKFSLYIAAGLPVIAPESSAISDFIITHGIGVLIKNLRDLESLSPSDGEIETMQKNVMMIKHKVLNGYYMNLAVTSAENTITPSE